MTRRRKALLLILALGLSVGAIRWYWQATAVNRQVKALLEEVRQDQPSLAQRCLIKLRLSKDWRTARSFEEVGADLAKFGPSAVPELIRALQDSDWVVGWVAINALGKLGDARAVQPLAAVLKDEQWMLRKEAAETLGMLGHRHGVEALIAALKDESEYVRKEAAGALGKLGDARAVAALTAALKDESQYVRKEAAWALGKLGDARAVGPLEEVLRDDIHYNRETVSKAIEKLEGQSGGRP